MKTLAAGGRLGILGGGQLGRMLAIAARQMGFRVVGFSPEADCPLAGVADALVIAPYTDTSAAERFANQVDVVGFEFENVDSALAQALEARVRLRPDPSVLFVTQHRLREKRFLLESGFPVAQFAEINDAAGLAAALSVLGAPAILKTAEFGYDGKGQRKIESAEDGAAALAEFGGRTAVLERFVHFERELSVVAARSEDGEFAHFGVIENQHTDHILDVSVYPARIDEATHGEAIALARGVLEALGVVGVLCVELFDTGRGLVINELAPRPHNSGHLTIEAFRTSQFEQQLRAVVGLPLGSTAANAPGAAMANLLGDVFLHGSPNFAAALADPDVKLHLYGKTVAKAGRKMGHLTALAETAAAAEAKVRAARERLHP